MKVRKASVLFVLGLVAALVVGFFVGAAQESDESSRQIVLVGLAPDSTFISAEESRGMSHRDITAAYQVAVEGVSAALRQGFAPRGFVAEVTSSNGLLNGVKLAGGAGGPMLEESEIREYLGPLFNAYHFAPVEVTDVSSETEVVPGSVAGWQLGLLFAVGFGLALSLVVVLAQTLRVFLARAS
jgi:hypothetical protein